MEEEDSKLVEERRQKLKALRAAGPAFPNDFRREHLAGELQAAHGAKSKESLEKAAIAVTVAGRMMLKRVMGKASTKLSSIGTSATWWAWKARSSGP
jgi:lysyl-tRNA synthetase class 2